MRLSSILAIVSATIWTLLLWMSCEDALALAAKEIPGYPNGTQLSIFLGIPIAMLMLTVSASVAIRVVEHRAVGFSNDISHRIEPVPVFCLLMVMPYLVMMAI